MDYLIVVDMQNDFVSGALGTMEAMKMCQIEIMNYEV